MLAKSECVDVLNTKEITLEDVLYIHALEQRKSFERESWYRDGIFLYIDRDEYVYCTHTAVNNDWDLVLLGECELDVCRHTGLRGIKSHWLKSVYFRNIKTGERQYPLVNSIEFSKISDWFGKN